MIGQSTVKIAISQLQTQHLGRFNDTFCFSQELDRMLRADLISSDSRALFGITFYYSSGSGKQSTSTILVRTPPSTLLLSLPPSLGGCCHNLSNSSSDDQHRLPINSQTKWKCFFALSISIWNQGEETRDPPFPGRAYNLFIRIPSGHRYISRKIKSFVLLFSSLSITCHVNKRNPRASGCFFTLPPIIHLPFYLRLLSCVLPPPHLYFPLTAPPLPSLCGSVCLSVNK